MPVKIALLCDVDQTVYHVGDEAIATVSTRRLMRRGHEVWRMSRHEKYGPAGREPARTIPALTFPWPLEQRAAYLSEIRAVLAGDHQALPPEDKLFGIIEQFRSVDALLIGGGGSLNSRFGWLLDERLATALIASSLGKPVVLSGQSLGPELTPADRASVSELLRLCTLVGLRDEDSVGIARQLAPEHPAIAHCLDDAIGIGDEEQHLGEPDPTLISVTLGGDGDPLPREEYVEVASSVIQALAERTGARVEFVPHMADPDEGGGDEALHREVAARLSCPAVLHRIEDAETSAARTMQAGWVVSSRFHPVVFGAVAGSSVLALPLNRYGASRMDGALRNAGVGEGAVPLGALWAPATSGVSDLARKVVDDLVDRRAQQSDALRRARPELLRAAGTWWDTVSATLDTAAAEAGSPGVLATPAASTRDPRGAGLSVVPWWSEDLRGELSAWTVPEGRPTVSVIMRTRDRTALLDRAVQDVLAQTRRDWELLIVNDGGDPGPVGDLVAQYEHEARGRIRTIHRERSTGMEAASNAALDAARAPFIAVHDDDDTWHGTFLQETLAHLHAHPDHAAVVVRTLIVHERETPTGLVEEEVFPLWPELGSARLLDYLARNRNVPISMLYRRSVHDSVGAYDERLPVVGDYAFHLELLQNFTVGFLDRPLAQWRQRPWASGTAANSMIAAQEAHRHFDAELRERHLLAWTRENGIGLPLFIAKNTETQLERSEDRLGDHLALLRGEIVALRAELAEIREAQRSTSPIDVARRMRSMAGRGVRALSSRSGIDRRTR